MYRSGNILCIISLLALCSCNALKHAVNFSEEDINPGMFKEIPAILVKTGKTQEEADMKEIVCYRSVFKQSLVENGNVVDIALLNEDSDIKPVEYKTLQGYDQDLYMFRIMQEDTPARGDVFIYMAVKYGTVANDSETVNKYLSFPAIYLGEYAGDNHIRFYRSLKMKDCRSGDCHLELNGKRSLVFKTANSLYTHKRDSIALAEIILDEKNKVGGSKPVIFPMEKLFPDISTIKFRYLKSLNRQ
ncbi:MAG: hypothetical protein KDD45_15520 [Bdellovibrionales bacterium]|nr:hypothetical protein [Bdellovibrionales bacterium]